MAALGTEYRHLKELDPGDRDYGSVSAINIPSAKAHNNKDDLTEALAGAAAA